MSNEQNQLFFLHISTSCFLTTHFKQWAQLEKAVNVFPGTNHLNMMTVVGWFAHVVSTIKTDVTSSHEADGLSFIA